MGTPTRAKMNIVLRVNSDEEELAAVRLNSGAPKAGTNLGNNELPVIPIIPAMDRLEKMNALPELSFFPKKREAPMNRRASMGISQSTGVEE